MLFHSYSKGAVKTVFFSNYKRKFNWKDTEVVEVSQLGFWNKLKKQKKVPWNLGERKTKETGRGGGGKKKEKEKEQAYFWEGKY